MAIRLKKKKVKSVEEEPKKKKLKKKKVKSVEEEPKKKKPSAKKKKDKLKQRPTAIPKGTTVNEYIELLKEYGPGSFAEIALESRYVRNLIKNILKGKLMAGHRLNCILCFGGKERKAIAECPSIFCPSWHFRTGKNQAPNKTKRRSNPKAMAALAEWRRKNQ